jgi:hypothetical protein
LKSRASIQPFPNREYCPPGCARSSTFAPHVDSVMAASCRGRSKRLQIRVTSNGEEHEPSGRANERQGR